ncbi:hypothetical protein SAMN04489835_2723 [Mycolicibacterium rutilum]|uniref:Uncharacterized protein n=1 Tax=Mycolicibacterium rutilum TaxID=370526 RepID=A0A1H6K658_MYCRU|nr:hypothetical protein SAMN04489835_2723 [Mycolicibacterium rutilum]
MYHWIRTIAKAAHDFARGIDTAHAIRHGVEIPARPPSVRPARVSSQQAKSPQSTRLSSGPVNAFGDAERAHARLNSRLLAQIEEIARGRARIGYPE